MTTASEIVLSPSQTEIDALWLLINQGRHADCLAKAEPLLQLHPGVWQLHAIAAAAYNGLADLDPAIASFDAMIALRPDDALAYIDRANAQSNLGRREEAVEGYRMAIALQPTNAAAHSNCASTLYQLGRIEEALEHGRQAVAIAPDFSAAHFNLGNALKDLGHLDLALASYDRAIELQPDFSLPYCNRGLVLGDMGRREEALASYDQAIELQPDLLPARVNRNFLYLRFDQPEAALADCEWVLRFQPENPGYLFNRGNALRAMNRDADAVADYDRAIELSPDYVDAWNNRGLALNSLNRLEDALASYDAAVRLNPHYASAHTNRGFLLRDLNRLDEALASLDSAIALQPDAPGAYNNRGIVLVGLGRLDEAIADFDEAIALLPGIATATSQMIYNRAHICDWSDAVKAVDLSQLGIAGEAFSPLATLAAEDMPGRHLARARNWASKVPQPQCRPEFAQPTVKDRLRIGYFSADFNNHAVMYLIGRLFEVHDKQKFEVQAFSFGLDPWDEMRQRVCDAVDQFHDVSALSDDAVARLARDQGIDIAIDLNGYTHDERPGIFAHHAAPIQINYLGYPGTMGADFIDYIIADERLIPEHLQQFYSEKIIYLPHSYQANDDRRPISNRVFSRRELGLPDNAFVFCCFNANFKISPQEFDIWMRLLGEVEGSVLWAVQCNKWAEANLRREAADLGIDPARLIFAPKMPLADHLARHRNADLFLDTFNYNAHTTGSDALWAGLPFVTRRGEGFAARVGASLLHAVGLDELVTDSFEEYERLALHLATHPAELAKIRNRLAETRLSAPLFDSTGFARHIEQAYERAYQRYCEGLAPDHIRVQP